MSMIVQTNKQVRIVMASPEEFPLPDWLIAYMHGSVDPDSIKLPALFHICIITPVVDELILKVPFAVI